MPQDCDLIRPIDQMETALTPILPGQLPAGDKVLVFAAHPDDEIFGCGGALRLLVQQGRKVEVVLATDGEAQAGLAIGTRIAESAAAAVLIGYPPPRCLHLPDRGLRYNEPLIDALLVAMKAALPDVLLMPSPSEMHPDHRMLALAGIEAVRRDNRDMAVLFYEVGVPLRPNLLIDITQVIHQKRAAMASFASQLAVQRYDQHIEALNRFRSYTLPVAVELAEAYFETTASQLRENDRAALAPDYFAQRSMRLPMLPTDLPLVSVLVRSSDRATLAQALDSVATQTYPHIEIVVVNVTGRPHSPLGSHWGGHPIRFVDPAARQPRPAAANALLKAAGGEWLIFLDDDDWLMPNHIDRLVAAVRERKDAIAAYAGVACVGANGEPVREPFDSPYSRQKLMVGNFLPIHAVLFSRARTVDCCFDDALDLFEDWDFWLQVSALGNFVHVPGVSAVYRMAGQDASDVFVASRDTVGGHAKVIRKWVARDGLTAPSIVESMSQQQGQINYHEQNLAKLAALMQQQRETLEQALATQAADANAALLFAKQQSDEILLCTKRQAAHEAALLQRGLDHARNEIALMQNSRSWRMTRPLRQAAAAARRLRPGEGSAVRRAAYGPFKRTILAWMRTIYVLLPMPSRSKLWLKSMFFRIVNGFGAAGKAGLQAAKADHGGMLSATASLSHAFLQTLYAGGRSRWGKHEYVPYCEHGLDAGQLTLRAIAYYLPQFHPIPENDAWWGKGFTEWSNVTRALPQFVGHYQPKLPGDLGFYDLRIVDNMRKQAALARHYGLAGFCLYYYWFGGKRLLELPQQQILDNPDLDMPFCLCWANENWTRRWDGQEADVLMAQRYSPEDDLAMIADLAKSFRDPRYIRIEGKPVFLVYCPTQLPDLAATVVRWRSWCRENGIGELYLVAVESFKVIDPQSFGFDATCEFPPHQANLLPVNGQCEILNEDFEGRIYDYDDMASFFINRSEPRHVRLSGIATAWDNEARKPGKGNMFINATPATYASWLEKVCARTVARVPAPERIVFINAWNEWAEGAYLEPDRRYGYAYLHATANVLRRHVVPGDAHTHLAAQRQRFNRKADCAVIVHLFYLDLLDDLVDLVATMPFAVDVFVSVPFDLSLEWAEQLTTRLPSAYVLPVENRGRDIKPFFALLPEVSRHGYALACKLHSKKSPHRGDGAHWRISLWQGLLGAAAAQSARAMFEADPKLGLLAPPASLTDLAEPDIHVDNRDWLDRLIPHVTGVHRPGDYQYVRFPAGSMFWFRPAAMAELTALGLEDSDFETELGQLDGTLAHALERLFGLVVQQQGYRMGELRK
jgi:lipopolysaccharide biosynthesis protein/LmbE family N-acetylglucosaminyl deacetylase